MLSGDLENTCLLFFFMDGEALQSGFIFKVLDVLNEEFFFCINKGSDIPNALLAPSTGNEITGR